MTNQDWLALVRVGQVQTYGPDYPLELGYIPLQTVLDLIYCKKA